ncbi:hypothetical protein, partial [Burkholderia pseudomallei]|uniref:hypothetical protein n=1 Tax=Burkholderia pseudomallei TaxID=28450 RepID=UPI001CA55F09
MQWVAATVKHGLCPRPIDVIAAMDDERVESGREGGRSVGVAIAVIAVMQSAVAKAPGGEVGGPVGAHCDVLAADQCLARLGRCRPAAGRIADAKRGARPRESDRAGAAARCRATRCASSMRTAA